MDVNHLIHRATLAPSGHNTQPWTFSVEDNIVRIYTDFSRKLPVVDPDDHALYISLGCALENLIIAAGHHGLKGTVDYFPADEKEECLRVTLSQNGAPGEEGLIDVILVRQSNRSLYDKKAIPPDHIQKLIEANDSKSVLIKTFDTKVKDIEQSILKKIGISLFTGPYFRWNRVYNITLEDKDSNELTVPNVKGADGSTSSGVGWMGRWDLRDSNMTPTENHYVQFTVFGALGEFWHRYEDFNF